MYQYVKKGIELIPLITAAVIVVGYINIHSFYTNFQIDIYSYLETSEIVFSFASIAYDLVFYLLGLSMYLLLTSIIPNFFSPHGIESRQFDKKRGNKTFWTIVVLLIVISGIAFGETRLANQRGLLYVPDRANIVFDSIVIIPVLFVDYYLKAFYSILDSLRPYILIVLSFFLFVFYVSMLNRAYYDVLSEGITKYQVELSLNDSTNINSSKTLIFLGQTRKYFFFRDLQSSTNIIIPNHRVDEIRQTLTARKSKTIRGLIEGTDE
jgi:hypothetical protein